MPRTDSKNTPPTAQNTGWPKFLVTTALPLLTGAAVLLTTSCTGQETEDPSGHLSQTQAEERMKEHIDYAADEYPGDVELTPFQDPIFLPCEGEPGDDDHTVSVRQSFWVEELPEEKNEEATENLYTYWNTGHWEVTIDERPEKIHLQARNRNDQFRVKTMVSRDGNLSISAYSPCFQADGDT